MKFTEELELKEFFSGVDKVAFYGVGGMGKNLYIYLKNHGWEKKLAFFIVTKKNVDEFWGAPVKEAGELDEEERSLPVVIATRKNFHDSIYSSLAAIGATDIHTLSESLLNHVEYLANQSGQYDLGPGKKRHAAWLMRKKRIHTIWKLSRMGCRAEGAI